MIAGFEEKQSIGYILFDVLTNHCSELCCKILTEIMLLLNNDNSLFSFIGFTY